MEDYHLSRAEQQATGQQNLLLLEGYISQPPLREREDSTLGLCALTLIGDANKPVAGALESVSQAIEHDKSAVTESLDTLIKSIHAKAMALKSGRGIASIGDDIGASDETSIGSNALRSVSDKVTTPVIIRSSDTEVKDGKALLDEKGRFVRVVDAKYKPENGETVAEINLLSHDFDVLRIPGGPNDGKYLVTQFTQPKKVPAWSYGTFVAEKIGSPKITDMKVFDPDEFVPVRAGDSIHMIRAKNLQFFRLSQTSR